MRNYIRREFTVRAALPDAWDHLGRIANWTSWAKHIRRIEVEPPGMVTPNSRATLLLANGLRSTYQMIEFHSLRNWKWAGPFLWLRIEYDHLLESLPGDSTRVTFVVDGEGFGSSLIGRLFAIVYNQNLDRAIPALISEMNQLASRDNNQAAGRRAGARSLTP